MTKAEARERAIQIADGVYERAVEVTTQMLEERGCSADEIAAVVASMASEHVGVLLDINATFCSLAEETVH